MVTTDASKQLLIDVGRAMIAQDLTWGNAGNVSARLADGQLLMTVSGARLGELTSDDLVLCSLSGQVSATPKPSKELPMHRAVYEERPDVGAVLHGAPFYSTLVACAQLAVPGDLFVEGMYYLERVARVPYAHPGSTELGEAVRAKVKAANVLLLENHGVLVYDASVAEALMALQVLELTCRMVVTAKGAGVKLQGLSAETVEDFLENSGYKPKRRWP